MYCYFSYFCGENYSFLHSCRQGTFYVKSVKMNNSPPRTDYIIEIYLTICKFIIKKLFCLRHEALAKWRLQPIALAKGGHSGAGRNPVDTLCQLVDLL